VNPGAALLCDIVRDTTGVDAHVVTYDGTDYVCWQDSLSPATVSRLALAAGGLRAGASVGADPSIYLLGPGITRIPISRALRYTTALTHLIGAVTSGAIRLVEPLRIPSRSRAQHPSLTWIDQFASTTDLPTGGEVPANVRVTAELLRLHLRCDPDALPSGHKLLTVCMNALALSPRLIDDGLTLAAIGYDDIRIATICALIRDGHDLDTACEAADLLDLTGATT
jgi:hypothetical protein